jgi:hypothetical protein
MSARQSITLHQLRRRARIEAAIQRAIDLLDAMDADPDLEPDADDEDDDDPAEEWRQPVTLCRMLEWELRP